MNILIMNNETTLLKKPNKPSIEEVKKYIKRWKESEIYSPSEDSLNKLFTKYKSNDNLNEIIIKVCALDVIFSANAGRWFFEISKHILNYGFDTKLKNEELDINDFALVTVVDKKTNKTKKRNFYSFMTKYCNHHKPLDYPIYDSYVDEALWYFETKYPFRNFTRKRLKRYSEFTEILKQFRTSFKLSTFNLREIDQYLWLVGMDLKLNTSKNVFR